MSASIRPGRGGARPARGKRFAAMAAAAAAAVALAACGSSGSGQQAAPGGAAVGSAPVRVGILQIAPAAVLDATVEAFEAELTTRLAPRQVSFDVKNAQGDQSLITSIAAAFAASPDTGFAVIGTDAVIALAHKVRDKPIIAIAMSDPVGAKVARSLASPGGNVTGSTDYVDPAILLSRIMTISPAPRRIGTIDDPAEQNMQAWTKALKAAAARYPGLSIVESTVSGPADIPSAARSLVGRVDAELIGPDATVFSGLPSIGATAKSGKIPVYLCGGDATVPGILASIGPDYPTVGRLAADAAAKAFAGTPAGQVPFGQPSGVTFAVNKATMTALGVTLPAVIRKTATVQ